MKVIEEPDAGKTALFQFCRNLFEFFVSHYYQNRRKKNNNGLNMFDWKLVYLRIWEISEVWNITIYMAWKKAGRFQNYSLINFGLIFPNRKKRINGTKLNGMQYSNDSEILFTERHKLFFFLFFFVDVRSDSAYLFVSINK